MWGEEIYLDRAVADFNQTEEMLQISEGMFGPYLWGVYDILVLPPSFSYHGMEHPCLTFVSPLVVVSIAIFNLELFKSLVLYFISRQETRQVSLS